MNVANASLLTTLCLATLAFAEEAKPATANRLAAETSPYLRLHADNPVHWYAWGPDALAAAKAADKPIFLSIGYSSCHWCHVMNRESFADPEIAKYLNEHFICIKVDREERPDVDHVYMSAVQALTRHGGWPLSAFLLPDGRPFAGGTYFPPKDRTNAEGEVVLVGFSTVLERVVTLYRDRRADVERQAEIVTEHLRRSASVRLGDDGELTSATIREAIDTLPATADPEHAGFSGPPDFAPKFPEPSMGLLFLALHEKENDKSSPFLAPVVHQADRMAAGGIFDQIGGGFHRYTVDRKWVVPHFEKMLYDQAQLLSLYSKLHRIRPSPVYERVVEQTVAFLRREMLSPEGAFYSALDADSEHEEGKFYVWTKQEIAETVGSDADWVLRFLGASGEPNFEGKHIPVVAIPPTDMAQSLGIAEQQFLARWNQARAKLLAKRAERIRPFLDTKVITAWNALMIVGLAEASAAFQRPEYVDLARGALTHLLRTARHQDGGLSRHSINGQAKGTGYADDYAATILALLAIDRLQMNEAHIATAKELADRLLADFWDSAGGGFLYAGQSGEAMFVPVKESYDGAIPSSNSLAAAALFELARRTGEDTYRDRVTQTLRAFAPRLLHSPAASSRMLEVAFQHFAENTSKTTIAQAARPEIIKKIEIAPNPLPLVPGKETSFRLRIDVANNWHINANPASPKFLKPTVVSIKDKDVTVEKVEYPKGRELKVDGIDEPVSIYDGAIEIPVRMRVAAAAPPGEAKLTLQIDYQACDDSRCLAPARKTVSIPVRIASE